MHKPVDLKGPLVSLLEILDALGNPISHLPDESHQGIISTDGTVDHPIQRVFNGPGELTHHRSTHHATTTLQSVIGTTDLCQSVFVLTIGLPHRQELIDRLQDFLSFLNEDLEDFFVDQIVVIFLFNVLRLLNMFGLLNLLSVFSLLVRLRCRCFCLLDFCI